MPFDFCSDYFRESKKNGKINRKRYSLGFLALLLRGWLVFFLGDSSGVKAVELPVIAFWVVWIWHMFYFWRKNYDSISCRFLYMHDLVPCRPIPKLESVAALNQKKKKKSELFPRQLARYISIEHVRPTCLHALTDPERWDIMVTRLNDHSHRLFWPRSHSLLWSSYVL